MAWTAPATQVAGNVLTAAWLNTYVRDNMKVGRGHARAMRNAGNIVINSTSWTNLSTTLDTVLAGSTADILSLTFAAFWNSEAVNLYCDVMAVDSSTYFSDPLGGGAAYEGYESFRGQSGAFSQPGGTVWYTTVSGDYSGGNLTARMRVRTASAANKTLINGTNELAIAALHNHGPHVAP